MTGHRLEETMTDNQLGGNMTGHRLEETMTDNQLGGNMTNNPEEDATGNLDKITIQ